MRCLACGGDNPAGNRFCIFCRNPLVPAAPLPTSRVTGERPIHLERNGPVAAIKALAVFVLCAVISRVAWGPLSLPSRIINAILPEFAFGGLRPGTLSMYLFSAAVGLKTIAVPLALLVLVLRLRKALSKGAEQLIPRLPAGIRFLVAPAVATVIFVLSWAGAHYQVASGVGLLPQTIFPAVIGLYTFAVTSYGANLQASLASFFKARDKFPRLMRLIAAIGIPLAISLVITYQDRVSQEVPKEQFVVLVALGTSYLALTPRLGGLSSGVGRDTGAGPKPITARGGTMRSVGLWLGAGWLLYLFQKLFLADIALADDCSGPGDCLQTAGYNATLGVGGGIMGVGATGIANSLTQGGGGVAPEINLDKPFLMPGSGEAAKAADALFTKLSPEEQRRQQEMLAEQDRHWQVIESRAGREAVYLQAEDTGGQVAQELAKDILAPWITESEYGKSAIDYLGRQVVSQVTDKARTLDKLIEVTTGKTWSVSGEATPLNQEELAQAYDELYREGFKTLISSQIGRATEVDDLFFKTLSGSLTLGEGAKTVVNQSADSIAAGIEKGIDWL